MPRTTQAQDEQERQVQQGPSVSVTSYHNGGRVMNIQGNTPADIANSIDLSLQNSSVTVNDEVASPTQQLREGDYVAFMPTKVTSGNI